MSVVSPVVCPRCGDLAPRLIDFGKLSAYPGECPKCAYPDNRRGATMLSAKDIEFYAVKDIVLGRKIHTHCAMFGQTQCESYLCVAVNVYIKHIQFDNHTECHKLRVKLECQQ